MSVDTAPVGETGSYPAVRDAWTRTLPGVPFDPDQSWEAAGADSLKSLHLVLHLEQALGRRIPFDLISRQMTAASLATLLDGPAEPAATPSSLPVVFLVPGVFGDGPILAEFRRSFGDRLRFDLVELPDVDTPVAVLSDMVATGRFLADEIERRQPTGDLHLAGFSFGGAVAYEAARWLQARGRQVAFLGLLDSFAAIEPGRAPAHEVTQPAPASTPAPAPAAPAGGRRALLTQLLPRAGEGMPGYGERLLFGVLVALRRIELARRLLLARRDAVSPVQLIGRRKIVLGLARRRAIHFWRPEPLDVPVLLALSDEGARKGSLTHWERLCPSLTVARVPGEHLDIFSPAALAVLTPAFLANVEDAVARRTDIAA